MLRVWLEAQSDSETAKDAQKECDFIQVCFGIGFLRIGSKAHFACKADKAACAEKSLQNRALFAGLIARRARFGR